MGEERGRGELEKTEGEGIVEKKLNSGANVIKLFTAVIYCHCMVIPSFCVIKHYYYGKYHRMAVNYHGKMFL